MMSGKIDDDCSSVDSTSTFLIGDMQDFNKGKREVRPKNDNLTYHPTHHWWEPPLSAWFPEANREILYLLWIYNALVVVLARFTNLCGSPADVDDAEFCSEDFMLHEDMELRGFSLGLFLLLSFRANQGYDRFWEGRKMWGRYVHKSLSCLSVWARISPLATRFLTHYHHHHPQKQKKHLY